MTLLEIFSILVLTENLQASIMHALNEVPR